jgi:murein DD-endopeptidase MepM/ murein hydrolase activator NlpD
VNRRTTPRLLSGWRPGMPAALRTPGRGVVGAVVGILLAILFLGWSTTRHVAAPTSAREQRALVQVALPSELVPAPDTAVTTDAGSPPDFARRPPRIAGPQVKPLRKRSQPDVFIRTTKPLTEAELAKVLAKTGGVATVVATGKVAIGASRDGGTGSTTAIGVDPSTFRKVAPKGTAESTALWQAVARGDVAVAHTVAKALAVGLGEDTPVKAAQREELDFRVGAFATTGLPGVGVVVDSAYDDLLNLSPRTGLVISATGVDPAITAALAQQILEADLGPVESTPLRVVTDGAGRLSWVAPAAGPITSGYGVRNNPFDKGSEGFHPGIDIGAPYGAPIYAATVGVVSYAGPAQGFGNEVILTHPGGIQTVYGHMERILVTAGQSVRAGAPIALVGSEGESTGAHLHFEVHVGNETVDPLSWLIAHGVKTVR